MITSNAISPVPLTSRRNPHIERIAIFQIISGGLSLVLGIIGVIWYSAYDFQVGAGIWGSLLTIVTGIIGYQTVKKNAGSYVGVTYTAYMVLNIISAVFIAGAIFCASITAGLSTQWIDCDPNNWGPYPPDPWYKYMCLKYGPNARASWGSSMILEINLSAACVPSIIGSILSCVCCERSINSGTRYTTGSVTNQLPMAQVVVPNQYIQQPQISSPYQQQQQQHQQQPPIIQQQPMMSQQQPNSLQQSMVQPQPMILQQSANQQSYFLQQYPEQQQAQAQAQPVRPRELMQPKIHVNSFSQQIDEELPKKGENDIPSYDSLQ